MASQAARRRKTAKRRHDQKAQTRSYNAYMAERATRTSEPMKATSRPVRLRHRPGWWLGRGLLATLFVVPLAVGYWKLFHPAP
jgi:hypothetical protein